MASGESRKIGPRGARPRFHEFKQIDDEFLSAFHRKSWNEQRAAGGVRFQHLAHQHIAPLCCRQTRTFNVAIGGFEHQMIDVARSFGIIGEIAPAWTDVAGKQDAFVCPFAGNFHFDRGRAQYVACIPPAGANIVAHLRPIVQRDPVKLGNDLFAVGAREDRAQLSLAAALLSNVQRFDFHFLNGAGVGQHHPAKFGCPSGGEDRALETRKREFGEKTAMVDMGVGQQHGVDTRRVERKRLVIEGF